MGVEAPAGQSGSEDVLRALHRQHDGLGGSLRSKAQVRLQVIGVKIKPRDAGGADLAEDHAAGRVGDVEPERQAVDLACRDAGCDLGPELVEQLRDSLLAGLGHAGTA